MVKGGSSMEDKIKEHRKRMAKVIAKAWSDESFKEKFLSDPKAVLERNGITVPPGAEIKVVEQTEKLIYIVLPFKPDANDSGKWMTEDDAYDPPCARCV
jgi:hypothetical protein